MKRENENNTSKNQRLNNMHTTTTKKIKKMLKDVRWSSLHSSCL